MSPPIAIVITKTGIDSPLVFAEGEHALTFVLAQFELVLNGMQPGEKIDVTIEKRVL